MGVFGLAFLCLVMNFSGSLICQDWWVVEIGAKRSYLKIAFKGHSRPLLGHIKLD